MMQWIKMLLIAFVAIFISAIVSEIPPFPAWFAMVDANQTPWLFATGACAVLGFTLMMGGILKLLMDQDETLSHADVEDVERSVRMAARPVTWRASSYRVWGRTAGQQGSEQFSFGELKRAWKSGAVWHDPIWKRRLITAIGALMLTVGLFGSFVVMGPPWLKILMGGLLLYAMGMISRGVWRA